LLLASLACGGIMLVVIRCVRVAMDNENTAPEKPDISIAEPSTRKKLIIYVLIVSVPIAAGLVAQVVLDTPLSMAVMYLVAGLLLLTLVAFKWNWFKKYMPGLMNKVRVSDERSARKQSRFMSVFFIVLGIVWVVLGVI